MFVKKSLRQPTQFAHPGRFCADSKELRLGIAKAPSKNIPRFEENEGTGQSATRAVRVCWFIQNVVALRSDKPVPSFASFFIAAGVADRLIVTVPDFFTSATSILNLASGSHTYKSEKNIGRPLV